MGVDIYKGVQTTPRMHHFLKRKEAASPPPHKTSVIFIRSDVLSLVANPLSVGEIKKGDQGRLTHSEDSRSHKQKEQVNKPGIFSSGP